MKTTKPNPISDTSSQLESASPAKTISRREFLGNSVKQSSATALTLATLPLAAETETKAVAETQPPHPDAAKKPGATLIELRFGSIRPEGWLKQQLEKQRDGLTGNLLKICWPFTADMWIKDQVQRTRWGGWEQRAYWCDGAVRCAIELDDQALLDQALPLIQFTLSHPGKNGYVGPTFLDKPGDFHRWVHTVLFRAVMALFEARRDRALIEPLVNFYSGGYAFVSQREQTHIEIMLWLYSQTGDRRLLALAEKTWAEYQKKKFVIPDEIDLSEKAMLTPGPVNCHGVTYAEHTKLPAILYLYTGNRRYLDLSVSAQNKVFAHHMLVDGIPSTTEWLGETSSRDGHETCNVIDYSWNWGYLLMATGGVNYADQIERATFNAGMGALKRDWRALQYYSSPNQFICTGNSDHFALTRETSDADIKDSRYMQRMSYRPAPGWIIACCTGNVNRFLPNYVGRMWMRDAKDGGLTATLYGPCRVKTTVGAGKPVEIFEDTNYPFSERIDFRISCAEPVEFSLRLRIPAWCKTAKIQVNGKDEPVSVEAGSFTHVRRRFANGDCVSLLLPMEVSATTWPDNGLAVERGPLVYSLPVQGKWQTVADDYSTPEFPAWDLSPTGSWNYALQESERKDAVFPFVKAVEQPGGADLWAQPPVALSVKAKRVKNWDLAPSEVLGQDCVFTPRLPDPALLPEALSEEFEEVLLKPFGTTDLRLTVFPRIKPAWTRTAILPGPDGTQPPPIPPDALKHRKP